VGVGVGVGERSACVHVCVLARMHHKTHADMCVGVKV